MAYWKKDSSLGDHATMLRTKKYKLVVAHGHEAGELYDLEYDPQETQNLWNSPKHSKFRSNFSSGSPTAWLDGGSLA